MIRVFLPLLLLLSVTPVQAETLWQRVSQGTRSKEFLTRQSVERVSLGTGDERDLMRVRVGLITLSRGEVSDPRTVILLFRLRREMGLATSQLAERLLTDALGAELSLTERAWARLELAHLALDSGNFAVAITELDRAARLSWQTHVRAEVLLVRGLTHLRASQTARALSDFRQLQGLPVPRRLRMQAKIGVAVAQVMVGDQVGASEEALSAYIIENSRASVSRMDPFWDLPLSDAENATAHALLLWGHAEFEESRDGALSSRMRANACAALGAASSLSLKESESGLSWAPTATSVLAALWREPCAEAAQHEAAQPEAAQHEAAQPEAAQPEAAQPEADVESSTSRGDEDDF